MPTLHVRNVPKPLYKQLRSLAEQERRSMSAQVITLLERAVVQPAERRQMILDRMRAQTESIRLPKNWPGSLALLREDRQR